MTQIALGILADALGACGTYELEQGPTRPELRFKAWSSPSVEYRAVQRRSIAVDQEHGGPVVGQVVHLELDRDQRLWCVAELADHVDRSVRVKVADKVVELEGEPLYWSARHSSVNGRDIELLSVSLTTSPARVAARPVRFVEGGGLDYVGSTRRWNHQVTTFERELLERAEAVHIQRRRGRYAEPIIVRGAQPRLRTPALEYASTQSLELRSASTIDVNARLRECDLLIAPAELPATIFERGRSFSETFAHGCFSDSADNPEKVKLNRDHEIARTIGRAVAIDPWSELGTIGRFKVSKVADGDEALELLADGVAACSAGFSLAPGGDSWLNATTRRITRAILRHVAVTADPAHATAVLEVRRGDFALH